jgi:hypothetical protein
MAKITALTALTAPVDTDFMVIVDESTGVTKKMELQYLLVALDGDHLDIDFTPTYYTPVATPAEADDADDLAAHLYGIDQKLVGLTYANITGTTTFTAAQRYLDIDTALGAITGTLPSAATLGAGFHYIFKLADATAAFTLATNGAETIEGADSWVMTALNETLEIISDGTNWKVIRVDVKRTPQRARFLWKDADEIYINPGCYEIKGGQYPFVYWDSQLTFQGGSGGSNASSDDLTATGWHYIFIDDSAVDTNNSPLLTNACFRNETTAPTWTPAKNGWYTGLDRCIFAVYVTAANNIDDFEHSGDYMNYVAQKIDRAAAKCTTWTDVTLTLPAFAFSAQCTMYSINETGGLSSNLTSRWRTNGSSGVGHVVTRPDRASGEIIYSINSFRAMADSTFKIEVDTDTADDNVTLAIHTDGYYLPEGL